MLKRLPHISSQRPLFAKTSFRTYSQSKKTPWREDVTAAPSVFVEDSFAKHTVFVLNVARRMIKFSFIGFITLATTVATGYEAMHLWVENTELAPEDNADVKKWQWDLETERWSGQHARGGTDPALGFKGRHIVRAAWMSQNWGVGYSTAVIGSKSTDGDGLPGPAGLNVIDARLQRTEDFLSSAISIAEHGPAAPKLHPDTLSALIIRHASVLERLGSHFLSKAKEEYERVWASLPKGDVVAPRLAVKLGDLSSRLGHTDAALSWWSRAIVLAQAKVPELSTGGTVVIPQTLPPSPLAQRTITSALVSLSAFYAMSGQYKMAQFIEEASLGLLKIIHPHLPLTSASPPETLHNLYILQRSSLLSIHLAEVLHAQHQPIDASIPCLASAAEASAQVARTLTGKSIQSSDRPKHTDEPLPSYTGCRSMNKVASGLLRDARRTAAEAWNLMGVLHEAHGSNPESILNCYEHAIGWAGDSNHSAPEAPDGILESEWKVYRENYLRAKQVIHELAVN